MESETWPGASSDKKQWMKAITALFLEQEDCDGNFQTTMPYVPFSVFKTQTVKI